MNAPRTFLRQIRTMLDTLEQTQMNTIEQAGKLPYPRLRKRPAQQATVVHACGTGLTVTRPAAGHGISALVGARPSWVSMSYGEAAETLANQSANVWGPLDPNALSEMVLPDMLPNGISRVANQSTGRGLRKCAQPTPTGVRRLF